MRHDWSRLRRPRRNGAIWRCRRCGRYFKTRRSLRCNQLGLPLMDVLTEEIEQVLVDARLHLERPAVPGALLA